MAVSNFQTLDFSIFKRFEIWYPILLYLYLGSRISYRKVFVLQTKLWIPPFQWIMSQAFSMFVAREIKQKLRRIFFETPTIGKQLWHLSYFYLSSNIIYRYLVKWMYIVNYWNWITGWLSNNHKFATSYRWSGTTNQELNFLSIVYYRQCITQ